MATIYVDASRPDDTGNGLTTATAKRTYNAGYALMVDGDTLSLRRGYCYSPASSGYSSFRRSNSSITSYAGPNEDRPCLDTLIYQIPGTVGAQGWTSEGDGVWSKQFSSSYFAYRLWVGARNSGILTTDRSPGTAMSRTPDIGAGATQNNLSSIKATLTTKDIWYGAGSALGYKVYVLTGSDIIDPPTFYDGIAILQNDGVNTGSLTGINITNAQNVSVTGIAVRGASTSFKVVSANTDAIVCENITFDNCYGSHLYSRAFVTSNSFGDYGQPWPQVKNVLFNNCTGDSGSSQEEQETDSTKYGVLSGSMDMFAILHNSYNCRAVDCTSINPMHIGALVGGQDNNLYYPDLCGYLRHRVLADDWTTYARGCTSYNVSNTCYIKNCTFDGCNVRSQFSGSIQVTGNIWKNMRQSTRKSAVSGAWAIESYIANFNNSNFGDNKYVYIQPTGMLIAHNLVVDPVGTPLEMNLYPTVIAGLPLNTFSTNTVAMYNNIILDTLPARSALPSITTSHTGATPVSDQLVKNNTIFKSGVAPTIKWDSTTYALNAYNGFVSNISTDPLLTLLDSDQPKVLGLSPCRYAGKYLGDIRARNGVFPPMLPTIGVYEFTKGAVRSVIRERTIIRPRG